MNSTKTIIIDDGHELLHMIRDKLTISSPDHAPPSMPLIPSIEDPPLRRQSLLGLEQLERHSVVTPSEVSTEQTALQLHPSPIKPVAPGELHHTVRPNTPGKSLTSSADTTSEERGGLLDLSAAQHSRRSNTPGIYQTSSAATPSEECSEGSADIPKGGAQETWPPTTPTTPAHCYRLPSSSPLASAHTTPEGTTAELFSLMMSGFQTTITQILQQQHIMQQDNLKQQQAFQKQIIDLISATKPADNHRTAVTTPPADTMPAVTAHAAITPTSSDTILRSHRD